MTAVLRDHHPVAILGTGSYLPDEVVTNGTVAARTGTTEDWIVARTGIHRRWYAAPHEATSDLATHAARAALEDAGVRAGQVRWIIVATSTPDHTQPPTACLVQHRLGAADAAAFDVNAVCSGFVFALATAVQLLRTPSAEPGYALVIGADVYSRIIDHADRGSSALFGDGAGAVLLGPAGPGGGVLGWDLKTDGDRHDLIRVEAGGSRTPASTETLESGQHRFRMQGRAVGDFVRLELPRAVERLLARYDVAAGAVTHFIPHQANGAMLRAVEPDIVLPNARMHLTVDEHGNTSAASIPITMDHTARAGAFRDGDLLLLAGFGGGMSVGTALVRWCAVRPGDVNGSH